MTRLLILLGFLLPVAVLAQEADSEARDEPTAEEGPAADETSSGADVTDEEIEELLGLDEEDYAEIEEDDFDASIEVRYEQSVPFPTDI
jgi:hypothetical protein